MKVLYNTRPENPDLTGVLVQCLACKSISQIETNDEIAIEPADDAFEMHAFADCPVCSTPLYIPIPIDPINQRDLKQEVKNRTETC